MHNVNISIGITGTNLYLVRLFESGNEINRSVCQGYCNRLMINRSVAYPTADINSAHYYTVNVTYLSGDTAIMATKVFSVSVVSNTLELNVPTKTVEGSPGVSLAVPINATDNDGDTVTFRINSYSGAQYPQGMYISSAARSGNKWYSTLSWPTSYVGTYAVNVVADDGYCGTACPTKPVFFSIMTSGIPPPLITTSSIPPSEIDPISITTSELPAAIIGKEYRAKINAIDRDGQQLFYHVLGPPGMEIMPYTGEIYGWTPTLTNTISTDTITVSITRSDLAYPVSKTYPLIINECETNADCPMSECFQNSCINGIKSVYTPTQLQCVSGKCSGLKCWFSMHNCSDCSCNCAPYTNSSREDDSSSYCFDKIDNDCDQKSDCQDPDCSRYCQSTGCVDVDKDGLNATTPSCLTGTDCDDTDPYIRLPIQYYQDKDLDGFGGTSGQSYCQGRQATGFVNNSQDCDDSNPDVHETNMLYLDNDGDGHGGKTGKPLCQASAAGYVSTSDDCDDSDPEVYTGSQLYLDNDLDGFGSTVSKFFCQGDVTKGYVSNSLDCDDSNPSVTSGSTYFKDDDLDGFGSNTKPVTLCPGEMPDNAVLNKDDCDDSTIYSSPTSKELCDGKDNDCDGETDEDLKRNCFMQCPMSLAPGNQVCKDGVWQECLAQCPPEPKIYILSPRSRVYYVACDQVINIPVKTIYLPDVKCYYKIDNAPTLNDNINVRQGKHTFTAVCAEKTEQLEFEVVPAECLAIKQNNSDVLDVMVREMGLSSGQKENANQTLNSMSQDMAVSYIEDSTVIRHTLSPDKEMSDVNVNLYIPKCMTKYLDEIEFDFENYTVIKDDPLIAWHFAAMTDQVDLSYKIKGKIDPACMEQIKLLPIAQTLGKNIRAKGPEALILPAVLVILSISVLVYLEKMHHDSTNNKKSESELMLETTIDLQVKHLKDIGIKGEDAEKYLRNLNLPKETVDKILKKL